MRLHSRTLSDGSAPVARPRLFYLTDGYPYGLGEKPFVGPEIAFLSSFFDITVVSVADRKARADREHESTLPDGVRLLHCEYRRRPRTILEMFRFPFTSIGRSERSRIRATGQMRFRRSLLSAYYYGLCQSMRAQLRRLGIFEDADGALYYSFWFGRTFAALALEKAAEHPRMRIVGRTNGYELYEERGPFGWQCLQRFKAEQATRIISPNEHARTYLIDHYLSDMPDERLERLAPVNALGCAGPDHSVAPRAPRRDGEPFVLVSCSNLIPLKRVDLIAEALEGLRDLDIRWIHFGTGSEQASLESYARDHGLPADFRGWTRNEDVLRHYAEEPAHAFITATSTEGGSPVSIQEAMAYGLPIIGTAVGGIPDQIQGNGVLLDANPSVEEIRDAIRSIYHASDERYAAMSQRSYELWQERFDVKNCLDRTLAILQEAMQEAGER